MPTSLPKENMIAKEHNGNISYANTDRNAGSFDVEKGPPLIKDIFRQRTRGERTTYALSDEGREFSAKLWREHGKGSIDFYRAKLNETNSKDKDRAYKLILKSLEGKRRYESSAASLGEMTASNSPWNEVFEKLGVKNDARGVFAFSHIDKVRRMLTETVVANSHEVGEHTDQVRAIVENNLAGIVAGYLNSSENDLEPGKIKGLVEKAVVWSSVEDGSLQVYLENAVNEAVQELTKVNRIQTTHIQRAIDKSKAFLQNVKQKLSGMFSKSPSRATQSMGQGMSRRNFLKLAGIAAGVTAVDTASGGPVQKWLRQSFTANKPITKSAEILTDLDIATGQKDVDYGDESSVNKRHGQDIQSVSVPEGSQPPMEPSEDIVSTEKIEVSQFSFGPIALDKDFTIIVPAEIVAELGLSPTESDGSIRHTMNVLAITGDQIPEDLNQQFSDLDNNSNMAITMRTDMAGNNIVTGHSGEHAKSRLPFDWVKQLVSKDPNTFIGMGIILEQDTGGSLASVEATIQNSGVVDAKKFAEAGGYYPNKPAFYRTDVLEFPESSRTPDTLSLVTCSGWFSPLPNEGFSNRSILTMKLVEEPPKREIEPGLQVYADYIIDELNDHKSPYGKAYKEDGTFKEEKVWRHDNSEIRGILTSQKAIDLVRDLRPDLGANTSAKNFLDNILIVSGEAVDKYMRDMRHNSEGTTPMSIDPNGKIHFNRIAFRSDAKITEDFVLEELIQLIQCENVIAGNQDYLATVGIATPEKNMQEFTDGNIRAICELVQQRAKREYGLAHNPYYFEIGGQVFNKGGDLNHSQTVDAPFEELINILWAVNETEYSAKSLMDGNTFAHANETFRKEKGYNIWEIVGLARDPKDPIVEAKREVNIQTALPWEKMSLRYENGVKQWTNLIVKNSRDEKVPTRIVTAVVDKESGGVVDVRGSKGEVGLMQIMPSDNEFSPEHSNPARNTVKDLLDPQINISAGAYSLAQIYNNPQQGNSDWRKTLAHYNAGDDWRNPAVEAKGYAYADDVLKRAGMI